MLRRTPLASGGWWSPLTRRCFGLPARLCRHPPSPSLSDRRLPPAALPLLRCWRGPVDSSPPLGWCCRAVPCAAWVGAVGLILAALGWCCRAVVLGLVRVLAWGRRSGRVRVVVGCPGVPRRAGAPWSVRCPPSRRPGGPDSGQVACTRGGRVLNKVLALTNRECQMVGAVGLPTVPNGAGWWPVVAGYPARPTELPPGCGGRAEGASACGATGRPARKRR